ncbi:hypothetical protein BH09SUM1_BH09SUM1_16050 [soil metagenome]
MIAEQQAPPATLTYGQEVWRHLRRNKLAMVGALVIAVVVLVSILCPLLANQRPLYIKAVLVSEYANAAAVLVEQINAGVPPEALRERFRDVAEHLDADDLRTLDALQRSVEATSGNSDAVKALATNAIVFQNASPVAVVRFPAFRALTLVDTWLLWLLLGSCLLPLLSGFSMRFASRLIVLVFFATVATLLCKLVYPTIKDATPYRRIISQASFSGNAVRTIVPYGENENIISEARMAPSWAAKSAARNWHLYGTDTNGRDVLARMIYGARVSMFIGIFSVTFYTIIGVVLGAVAGYFQGLVDIGLSRLIEVFICFPGLIVLLAIQVFLPQSLFNIVLGIAILMWTGVARLQRAEFLRLVNMDFVQSVRALGGSNLRIIFLHILPNGMGPILVMVSFGIANSIVLESSLSYLGFGVPQPMASWGDLLHNGANDIIGLWWLTLFPGLAIFITVTCFNLLGEGVRDALDPRRS